MPRLTTPITLYDNGEGLAERAIERLQRWGYQDVALLAGGLTGWQRSGGELFQDVNSPSKAFGELVESERQTPLVERRGSEGADRGSPAGRGGRRAAFR